MSQSDEYVNGLIATGKSIARRGGEPPSYTDVSTYVGSSVIKTAYEKERKKMNEEKSKKK